jgi:hypothetical protein
MRRFLSSLLLCSLTIGTIPVPTWGHAGPTTLDPGFDPNLILTDDDVFNVSGMNYRQMVNFMQSKGPLANYITPDINGVPTTTPAILWRVAHSYKINPKFLLAVLQKEQSLIEDPSPSQKQYDWATGFGVCDDCSMNDPSIQDYKGFANQIEYLGKQMRERYFLRLLTNGQTRSGYAPGKEVLIDGIAVTPHNKATASLYTYTPHIHGNLNLWRIWHRWFSKQYPDGTVVRGLPSKQLWWIRLNQRRRFVSSTVASSLVDTSKVIETSDTELSAYEEGPEIAFPNYALLRDPKGTIWLLVHNERRRIANMATFKAFGFNEDELEDVQDEDLASYDVGMTINEKTKYPQGALLQDSKTKELWYAEHGQRHLIQSPVLLSLYFKNRKPRSVTSLKLSELTIADPYPLRDGELVKASNVATVYVMERGLKRPIPSGTVFESLGWKWKNVVTVPATFLENYPEGDPVLSTPVLTKHSTP